MRRWKVLTAGVGLVIAGVALNVTQQLITPPLRRRLSTQPIHKYNLPKDAQEWCQPSLQPPLDYQLCDHRGIFYQVPFVGGLTNGLKMILLTTISSFEKNHCFFVTEDNNDLLERNDKTQKLDSLLARYFEPIGLSKEDPIVQKAIKERRVKITRWRDFWVPVRKRKIHGMLHNITSLGYVNMESTVLKKIMLQRMWRFLPHIRDDSCATLESHGLQDEYLAFSVRRGDKNLEGFHFTKSEEYIDAAEVQIQNHFGGKVPKIFVATDDCAVMLEFRGLRPNWSFTSECDRSTGHDGFILTNMRDWTLEQTDEHFRKFFVELIGLAGAKFFIGVSYTNVAWWAAYMRAHRWSNQYLDVADKSIFETLSNW